jgi:hypothetical protein
MLNEEIGKRLRRLIVVGGADGSVLFFSQGTSKSSDAAKS